MVRRTVARPLASRELFQDRRIVIFVASVVLFHFANAAMLPLVGQKSSDGLKDGALTRKNTHACAYIGYCPDCCNIML